MTGYTRELIENGQPFANFVMGCARGFVGQMRDRSGDIPTSFKVDDYHKGELKAAERKLAKLKKMTAEQRLAYGQRVKKALLKAERGILAKSEEENKRVEDMIVQVKAWRAPSKNHQNLKKYMLEWLAEEIDDLTFNLDRIKYIESRREHYFWNGAYKGAVEDVAYHTKELKLDVKDTLYINNWLKQLRGSL